MTVEKISRKIQNFFPVRKSRFFNIRRKHYQASLTSTAFFSLFIIDKGFPSLQGGF